MFGSLRWSQGSQDNSDLPQGQGQVSWEAHQAGIDLLEVFDLKPNYREGAQPSPSAEIWIKGLLAWPCPPEQDPASPQPVFPIRKLAQTPYPHPPEGWQNENHNHRKLTKMITWITALCNSMKPWTMPCRPPKMDRSWWRVLIKCDPLEKGISNHLSILGLRIPLTGWKGKDIWHWKMKPPGQQVTICY